MKIRRVALLCAIAFALIATFALSQQPPPARASAPIYQALDSLKNLSNNSFLKVVAWARKGAPSVFAPSWDYQNAEAGINTLSSGPRWAVLQWLTGNGRGALYSQGVNNSDIGPNRPGADYPAATPTPDPWRSIQLATESLDAPNAAGPIQVLGGFGAAKRDGTAALACVSFQNNGAQAATSVAFQFTLKDGNGNTVGTLPFVRKGTFSPGVGIHTWADYPSWRSGTSNRGYNDNCFTRKSGIAALPIIEARFLTYAVTGVTYADGSTWSP